MEQGLIRYFTGIPCCNGHLDERYVKNNACCTCAYQRVQKYEAKNWQLKLKRCRDRNALPEEQKRKRNRHLLKTFGITQDQYNEMLDKQGGGCAICKKQCSTSKSLAVDHCHATGKIRGILCQPCNTTLGKLDENIETLKAMINYIENGGTPNSYTVPNRPSF